MTKYIILLLFFIFICLISYSYFYEPNCLVIKKYKIKDENLKNIKIVFVGDFHIKPNQENKLKKVVNMINEQNADIVLSSGDFIAGHKIKSSLPIEKIAKNLSEIKSKYGFYTTLGNHDYWSDSEKIKEEFSKYNIVVLENENKKININGKNIYIAGIEDELTRNPDINLALKNTENPTILLTHSPDMFVNVPKTVNLTLAGHVHGGQIRLPFIGATIIPSRYGNRFSMGLIEENNKKMIVTTGIGTSILPLRFLCKPDFAVIEFY